jgi:hypothetical protein
LGSDPRNDWPCTNWTHEVGLKDRLSYMPEKHCFPGHPAFLVVPVSAYSINGDRTHYSRLKNGTWFTFSQPLFLQNS